MQASWETAALLVAVLGPLVGIPMSAMTLYLRAIRDQAEAQRREGAGRLRDLERQTRDLTATLEHVERDFTTREEWLRESMLARQQLERLTEMVARVQTRLEDGEGLVGHLGRAADAMLDLARGLLGADRSALRDGPTRIIPASRSADSLDDPSTGGPAHDR